MEEKLDDVRVCRNNNNNNNNHNNNTNRNNNNNNNNIYIYVYMYKYMYVYVLSIYIYIWVCVCERFIYLHPLFRINVEFTSGTASSSTSIFACVLGCSGVIHTDWQTDTCLIP